MELDKLKCRLHPRTEHAGNTSVSLLLKDRPEIAEILKGHDALKLWLVEQFSGSVTKFPIQWDPKEPEDSDCAEHCPPRENEPAKIRVSRNMSGLDQLSGVIFELFNIRNHKRFNRLWKKACNGRIDKQEYSRRAYRLEYKAGKNCKQFFRKNSTVFVTAGNSNTVYNRIMAISSFQAFFANVKKQESGEIYFEKIYEKRIAPYRRQFRLKFNKRDLYFYRHGPSLILVLCAVLVGLLSLFQLDTASMIAFLLLPLGLLLWLVYMPIKNRRVLFQFYYRMVAWLFLAIASASLWSKASPFIEEVQRAKYRTILTYFVIGLLGILMMNQFKKMISRLMFWFLVDSNPRSVKDRWFVVAISIFGLLLFGIGALLDPATKLVNAFTVMFLILLLGNVLTIVVSSHHKETVKPSENKKDG